MPSSVTIQKVTSADVDRLLQLSRSVFFDAFAHLNHPDDMEAYASAAFTKQKLSSEIDHPHSSFYFALLNDELVGYLKLNVDSAQTEFKDEAGLEVERIYVHSSQQGKQIGQQLLNFAIDRAISENRPYIWLGVWEHNSGAIRFYERKGFEKFGSHRFMLGSDEQIDILMKKILKPHPTSPEEMAWCLNIKYLNYQYPKLYFLG